MLITKKGDVCVCCTLNIFTQLIETMQLGSNSVFKSSSVHVIWPVIVYLTLLRWVSKHKQTYEREMGVRGAAKRRYMNRVCDQRSSRRKSWYVAFISQLCVWILWCMMMTHQFIIFNSMIQWQKRDTVFVVIYHVFKNTLWKRFEEATHARQRETG
jgi:hypothetical protein